VRFMRRLRLAADLLRGGTEDFSTVRPIDALIASQKHSGWSFTIDRRTALQVTAVLRGRNLICSIATLPLTQFDPTDRPAYSPLFRQIDPQVPNIVCVAQTAEDLLFEGIAWWRVTERGWNGFPVKAQHVDVNRVHLNPPPGAQALNLLPSGADPTAAVWVDTEVVPGRDMLRFDSPNPPLLLAARRAISRAVLLERTAEMYAKEPRGSGYFTPVDGADPADDEEIAQLLASWREARADHSEGYVPASLVYNTITNPSPSDLQLVELQARATLDLANAIGLDPEDLGISTTSRTYQNATDRRQDRINDVLAPYMRAITDRLSMDDVTRAGYRVAFDLSNYLKADPVTRATVAQTLHGLGAITIDEIRASDGRPVLTPAQRAELQRSKPAPPPQEPSVQKNSDSDPAIRQNFATGNERLTIQFDSDDFRVSAEKRTVSGLAIPYGAVGRNGRGRWRFQAGSLDWPKSAVSRVKLNREHNSLALLGAATKIAETEAGLHTDFKIARTPEGDRALTEAEDAILDGLSVEVEIHDYSADPQDADVFLVQKARVTGVALTGSPAFADARVTTVHHSEGRGNMGGDEDKKNDPGTTLQFTAEDLQAAISKGIADALGTNSDGPVPVNPRRKLSVNEELPYRFRGIPGEHEFSADIFSVIKSSDGASRQRLEKFFEEVFGDDVSTGDVNELNPTRNRPDLWVPQLQYLYPLWSVVNKGSIADATPFTVPAFGTATTVVSAHVEGTEPTAGVYTTTGQTITPSALSGKFEITRETIDQGGNPQVSQIIWTSIQNAYYEALEEAAATLLDGLSPTAIALVGTDADLDQDLVAAFTALQFVRGGNRFRDFFLAADLFAALTGAVDDRGRRLYPILAPSNTGGTTAPNYASVAIGDLIARPSWALNSTGDASSYLFNRNDVHGWASPPRRFDFDYQVKSVELGVMGYLATACTRLAGVREVTYAAA
jgi:HK97 family phage prohead protease